jgi:hypothetical protein
MNRFSSGILILVLFPSIAFLGCGYTTRGLYPDDIQTVAVPIFKNSGLRRGIEFQLTEKVIQTIEARTPYKVVDRDCADAVLEGEIASYFKNPNGEDGYDNPRGGIMYLNTTVKWIDNRTGEVIDTNHGVVQVSKAAIYNIDTAQSQATADEEVCQQVADQVITMMQTPW